MTATMDDKLQTVGDVSYGDALSAARLAVAVLKVREAEASAEAVRQDGNPPLDLLDVWRARIAGLPERFEGRRPSALEIAEQLRVLAFRLAGNGSGEIAANALALATVAARAEAEGDSVLCVVNRLVGED